MSPCKLCKCSTATLTYICRISRLPGTGKTMLQRRRLSGCGTGRHRRNGAANRETGMGQRRDAAARYIDTTSGIAGLPAWLNGSSRPSGATVYSGWNPAQRDETVHTTRCISSPFTVWSENNNLWISKCVRSFFAISLSWLFSRKAIRQPNICPVIRGTGNCSQKMICSSWRIFSNMIQ